MMQARLALMGAVLSASCWGRSPVCLPAGGSVWSYLAPAAHKTLPVTLRCGTPTLMVLKNVIDFMIVTEISLLL